MSSVSNKKWLQDIDVYDPDLDELLQEFKIGQQSDLKNLKQTEWEEVWRRAFVERVKSIKETTARQRLEKKLKKLERIWRKTSGSKISSIQIITDASTLESSLASNTITAAIETAPELKKWMKQKGLFLQDLFEVLVQHNIFSTDDFFMILDETWVEIKREVRVLRAQELKSNDAKARLENLLSKFEDEWRALEGKKAKKQLYDDEKAVPTPTHTIQQAAFNDLAEKGKELKAWMRTKEVWNVTLFQELVAADVCTPASLKDLKQKEYEEVVRKVKVIRYEQFKDAHSQAVMDKLLVKFGKLYEKSKK
mmetsp:Transcript_46609/g.77430  ORF Transcript_46609/g.77430 Transcript_46609/m.77430 type:complete len:308 (+) Transcript_46609:43-966(+)